MIRYLLAFVFKAQRRHILDLQERNARLESDVKHLQQRWERAMDELGRLTNPARQPVAMPVPLEPAPRDLSMEAFLRSQEVEQMGRVPDSV